jgi:hypothetical protein
MTKPIGYFTNYTPGDEGLLDEMQASWGAQFQNLNQQQRFWMLMRLAEDFCSAEGEPVSDYDEEVENAESRFKELSPGDRMGIEPRYV